MRIGQPILNQADILNSTSNFLAYLAYLLLVMERSFLVSFVSLYDATSLGNTTVKPPSICGLWQVSVALTICNCSIIYLVFVFWFSFPFISETVGKRLLKYNCFHVRRTPGAVDIVTTREQILSQKQSKKTHPNTAKTKKAAQFDRISAGTSSYRKMRLFLWWYIENKALVGAAGVTGGQGRQWQVHSGE